MDYITKDNIIIFAPNYNDLLDTNLLLKFNKLIFSDYELSDELFEAFENNNFKKLNFNYSKFNQKVNNLSPSITHLTFGDNFNQEVDNLPQGLTHLTFGNSFNQICNIPSSIKYIKLNGIF